MGVFLAKLLNKLIRKNQKQEDKPVDSFSSKSSQSHPRTENAVHIEHVPSSLNSIKQVKSYVVFDTETTGLNGQEDRVIEIALLKVENGKIVDELCTFVNPEKHIDERASQINHIHDENVRSAPTYERVGPAVAKFLGDCYLIGHNISFDLSFMPGLMKPVHLERDITWKCIDTCELARKAFPGAPNFKLQTLVKYLNINTYNAHRARADAVATLELFEKCREALIKTEPVRATTSHESELQYYSSLNVKPSEISPTKWVNPDNPLFGKNLVFTGDLSISRREAYQMAVNCGAVIKTTVSRKVDYLIVGAQDLSIVGADGLSGKQEKALQMNAAGKAHIEFINEKQFIDFVNNS